MTLRSRFWCSCLASSRGLADRAMCRNEVDEKGGRRKIYRRGCDVGSWPKSWMGNKFFMVSLVVCMGQFRSQVNRPVSSFVVGFGDGFSSGDSHANNPLESLGGKLSSGSIRSLPLELSYLHPGGGSSSARSQMPLRAPLFHPNLRDFPQHNTDQHSAGLRSRGFLTQSSASFLHQSRKSVVQW
jgi:hypothetical protein